MTKARLINPGAPVPALGSRQPRQRGAGGIEALTSYIAGQALDHRCSPYTLFSRLLIPSEQRLSTRWSRVRFGESHLINGYGEVAAAVAKSVATCTGMSRVGCMTLLGMRAVCDPMAKHLMHPTRPWCTACYAEARQHLVTPWDPLYSYVRTSKVCVWHRRPFSFVCSACGRGQRHLPKFPLLDYCERCGSDLVDQPTTQSTIEVADLEELLWMARAALDMIDALTREAPVSSDHFARNVGSLMERHFQGRERPFAARLGLAGSSPKNWVKRGSAPTWSSLADLAFRLDVPPAQLCSAEPPLTDPQYWRLSPAASLDRPHVRPTQEALSRIRVDLAERLRLVDDRTGPLPEGLPRIAKRLQIPLGVLKRHFAEECAQLVAQRAQVGHERRVAAERARVARIAAATAALTAKGLPATSRNLKRTGAVRVSDLVSIYTPS